MRWDSRGPQASACKGAPGFSLEAVRIVSAYGERRLVGPSPPRRAFGVPPGGPFDRLSAALACALAGLPDDAPVLEIALGPVVFEATVDVVVAVVGGPDGAFPLAPGGRLEVRPENARAYVASTPLSPRGSSRGEGPGVRGARLADPPRLGEAPFRVVAGPQAHLLDFAAFIEGAYRVGLASNRVGVRLEGSPNSHALSLPSEPAIPGVVQVPPSGEPIVLGPDGPTIGGYPKVAVVIDADLDRVGRLRPGDGVSFRKVSLEEAREAARSAKRECERRCAELQVLRSLSR